MIWGLGKAPGRGCATELLEQNEDRALDRDSRFDGALLRFSSKPMRKLAALAAAGLALLAPGAALAESAACAAIHGGLLDGTYTIDASGNTYTARDSAGGFGAGEIVTLSFTRNSGTSYVQFIRSSQTLDVRADSQRNLVTPSTTFAITMGSGDMSDYINVAITDYTIASDGTPGAQEGGRRPGSVTIDADCSVPVPTLSSFTYGSVVAYNPSTTTATNINVATGGNATQSPTSYTVSNASAGTYAASAATSGGGTVSINSAGLASYTPRVGYRGNDTFFAKATNGAGTSGAATVTVSVGNPTISASLSGSGAKFGTALSGYAVTPSGGRATYSCALNSGSAALPGGVTLGSNCALTGTPTTSGTFSFNVDITDSSITGVNGGTSSPYTQSNVAITNFVIALDAPTVTGVSPAFGPANTTTASVTVTGTSFTPASTVMFGSVAGTSVVVSGPASLTVTAPSQAFSVSPVDVRVTNATGQSAINAPADRFYYLRAPGPSISFSPTTINQGQTSRLSIQLTSSSGITINGVAFSKALTGLVIASTPNLSSDCGGSASAVAGSSVVALSGGSLSASATCTVSVDVSPTTTGAISTGSIAVTATSAQSITTGDATLTVNAVPPVLNAFSASAVAYGSTGNSINAASGTGATNSPTAWEISKDGTTFAGSAQSVNSSSTNASIDSSGVVTYAAPTGFRGNDSFYVRASNLGGNSNVVAVTVPVNNPALTIGLTGSGTRGTALAGVQITASGGTASYSCNPTLVSGALPAGVALNGDCTITGTPGASGSFGFTATVTDSSLPTGFAQTSGTLTLVIAPPAVTISPAAGALPGATAGTAYSQTLTASGGVAPYAYSLSAGALPAGVTIVADTLAGTPTAVGTFNFTITATDSASAGTGGPYTAANSYSITVAAPVITVAPAALPAIQVGIAYSTSITATGGNGAYTYARTAGTLPGGLTLLSDGTLSGTPTAGGAYDFTVTASDATTGPGAPYGGTRRYTGTVGAPALTITAPPLPGGTVATPYNETVTAGGGTAPYTFTTVPGTTPPGVTLAANGTLSGTPTAAGTFNFTVTAQDSSTGTGAPYSVAQAYAVTIAKGSQTINFGALSNASLSASPLTLSASASSGLTVGFASTTTSICTVSGSTLTLLQTGSCSITASQAGDSNWNAAGDVVQSFTVTPANLVVTPGAASGAQVGAAYSQSNPASGGVAPYAYANASGTFPAGTTVDPGTGTVSGTPTTAGSFSYQIKATDSQGPAVTATGAIVSVTIAKGNQTIGFTSTAPASAAVGGSAYTVGATATSGLTVTYTLDGTSTGCALAGTTVTFPSTGTCRINANQAGDSNWNPAAPAQQVFTVNAAGAISTTVSFSPASLGVGSTGTTTITFTNPNMSASPNIAPLFSSSALLTRSGTVGGSCGATGSDAGANFQFNAFSIPAGSCTVTLDYTGATAGASSGQVLGAFTPSGYPATTSATGNSFAVVPTATLISPNTGPVSQVVTITGTGFSTTPGNNIVNFDASAGTVTAASATSLTVTAPAAGSGAAAVTVTVNGQTSTGALTYTFIDKPIAANKPGVTVPYNSAGTAIDLSASITGGPHNSIAIGTAPAHGTTAIAGDVVTYTPASGYSGPDSFTYTATGAGGTSNVATVSITVALPAAPVAADRNGVTVPYNGAGTAIDLSASITGGPHNSIAIGTAPAHGTTSIAGDVVTYTPAGNYYGADSFTYTATGPGGTSNVATVTLTVATPPAPVAADKNGVAVAYNSAGTAIDLAPSVTGVHASIAIGTAPAHGTTSIAGDVVTYTPASGYYGADSFTYTATGPGGTSAPATVSLTVATPAAPVAADKSGVAVPYASTGTAIDLSASITGVHASIAIGTAPAHGTTSIAGDVVTYTPAAGYYGADSFTYTATGPGGTSNVATVSLSVATPAAPVAANKSGVGVAYNSAGTAIDLSASITGVHGSIAIGSAPAHGTTSIAGDVVTYTPAAGYFGADSFTYTATGPGGTSNVATVSLTVATPAAPVAADKNGVTVAYNSAGTAIDLAPSITGVHASIAIGTAPAHGTTSIAGDVVTYTPAAGYYGADSFTYTAAGPGGTSAPATVSLTVATPPAPSVADKSGVTVAYNSAGTAIDLSASVTGVHSLIQIGTAPAHGAVSIAGDVVTYTPATGYFGADSFTYTATGPGGTSSAATVSLTVATPAAPVAANASAAIPYNSAGTAVDLASSITGVHTLIQIGTAPAHGTVSIAGDVVTYKPAAGYYGADSFTYTATGPGGTSNAATVSLTVAAPPAPVSAPGTGSVAGASSVNANTSVDIDLSALVTGEYDTISIETPPAHGTVTLRVTGGQAATGEQRAQAVGRTIATYRPATGFTGIDTFTFYATGPGGRSAAAAVSVTVVGSAPVAQAKTASTGDGQTVTVDLTAGATEGPFTGAAVVSVTPVNSATTRIVDSGTGAARTFRLEVTPNARYAGNVTIAYTLSNAYGASAPATVTVAVAARPNPSADPNVRGISDAQAETARRFARGQVANFMRRTEQLHGGGGSNAMGVTLTSRDSRGLVRQTPAFDASALEITERMRPSANDPMMGRIANMRDSRGNRADMLGTMSSMSGYGEPVTGNGRRQGAVAGAVERPTLSEDSDGGSGERQKGSIAIWSGGAIDIGTRDATTNRAKITATTSGLSAGMDVKLADGVIVGLGGGYGNDVSHIGGTAARVRSTSSLFAAYASVSPGNSAFIDGMFGVGDLSFSTRRAVATLNVNAVGSRDGRYTVGAIAAGLDKQSENLRYSIYGRGEFMKARLNAYTETGAGRYNLRFDQREISSLTGTLGARIEFTGETSFARITPRVRAEWNHEFADADAQFLDYADIPGAALFSLATQGWARDQFQLGAGARFAFPRLWSFDIEAGLRGGSGEKAGTLRIQLSKEF